MRNLSPKSLILELLSVTGGNSISVKDFIEVGDLFGFTATAVRVSLARLAKDFLIESDERGYYRMSPSHHPLHSWLKEWRLGLSRVKKWDGRWLAVHLPSKNSSHPRKNNLKALDLLGFKEGLAGLWLRPHNLRKSLEDLRDHLHILGLETGAELFLCSDFKGSLITHWKNQLWSVAALQEKYTRFLEALKKSRVKCRRMPLERGMVETFVLGGEVIRSLARDPLLPEELSPTQKFQDLTEAMIDYDMLGRGLWSKRLKQIPFEASPAHLSLVRSKGEPR